MKPTRWEVRAAIAGGVAILAALGVLAWIGRGPSAAQLPAGSGWYCYTLPTTATCLRTGAECVESVGRATNAMVGYAPAALCRPQPAAWCFTWRDWREYQSPGLCFPTEERCEAFRAPLAAQPAPGRRSISRCGEVE